MTRRKAGLVVAVAVLVFGVGVAGADDRSEPVDIIVALDKSLSMVEEMSAVKDYVSAHIVDEILQKDDRLIVVAFYGQNELTIFDRIESDTDKERIKAELQAVQPNGAYTDIGFALDRLRDEVDSRVLTGRRTTLLLVTDGIAEPPPGSRYGTVDAWRGHEYMQVTSETQKEGWKVIVLGVGTESAEEIAQDLGGQYVDAGEEPTADSIADAMPSLVGAIELVDVSVTPVRQTGRFRVRLTLKTEGFEEPPEIVVVEASFSGSGETGDARMANLISEPASLDLPAEGVLETALLLRTDQIPPPGQYAGTLRLGFASNEQFDPAIPVEIRVNSFLQNFPWLLPVAAIVLIAAVVALVMASAARNRVRFRLVIEEKPLRAGRDEFAVRKGHDSFLRESLERFDVSESRSPKAIAKLLFVESALKLVPTKEERFPDLTDIPPNVLGARIRVRADSGTDFHLRFESAP